MICVNLQKDYQKNGGLNENRYHVLMTYSMIFIDKYRDLFLWHTRNVKHPILSCN